MEKQYNRKKQYLIIFIIILTILEIIWLFFGQKFSEQAIVWSVFVRLNIYTDFAFGADLIYKLTVLVLLLGILFCGWLLLYLTEKAVDKFLEDIIQLLDNIIDGKELEGLNLNQETYLSKCAAKLEKLHELMLYQRNTGAEDKTKMKTLISDISHQLRTPLSNMKILINTLGRETITKKEQDLFWQQLISQMDKIEFLIQSLIKASRLESGVIDIQRQELSIFDTLAQALGNIFIEAEKKKIQITVDCKETLLVYHDRKWTEEALFNILDNAVKYTPEKGIIDITVSAQEIYTEIKISDNGIGVSPEHYEDIFKRFYREDKVHDYNGIGIGLYLTRQIIFMQNGYITVHKRDNDGTVFQVYLPNKEM